MAKEFSYVDHVAAVMNSASALAVPGRLQPSAITEVSDMASDLVKRGHVTVDGNGVPLLGEQGFTPEEFVLDYTKTRAHAFVPVAETNDADETWLETSLTKQGARWKKL